MLENLIQIKSGIMIHVDASTKNIIYEINLSICSCENGKYLASITDNLVITCDEIIDAETKSNNEETKSIPINFKEKM